jgi:hypothetical protein
VADDSVIVETAKELGLKELAPEIYKDLLQPSVKEVGNGLVHVAKAVCLATAPLELTVWGYDKMKELLTTTLTKKLSKVPPEKIVAPALNVAGPILNNYPFVSEEKELRELYENLLASAMNEETKSKIHPSFSFLIQQITPEEALLIRYLPKAEDGWLLQEFSDAKHGNLQSELLNTQFEKICLEAGLVQKERFDSYLENLIRLRILFKDIYSNSEFVPAGERDAREPAQVDQQTETTVAISSYGWDFIEACSEIDT